MASFVALGHQYEVTLQALSGLGAEQPIAVAERRRAGRATMEGRAHGVVDAAAMVRCVNASPVMKTRVDDPMDLAVVQTQAATQGRRAGRMGHSSEKGVQ